MDDTTQDTTAGMPASTDAAGMVQAAQGAIANATTGIGTPTEGNLSGAGTQTSQVPDGAPAGRQLPNPPDGGADPAVVAATETKVYSDGSSATGPGPLPDHSPAQQDEQARVDALHDKATAATLADPLPPVVLTGSSVQPPVFTFENDTWKATYSLGEIVQRAATENGLPAEQWNGLDGQTREALIAAQVIKIKAVVENPNAVQRPNGLHNTIKELEVARVLTEIQPHETIVEPVHHEGAVQRFIDEVINEAGAIERRVMRIVADAEGKLRKLFVELV